MTPFPSSGPADHSALIATILAPRASWAGRMAVQDRNLQLQMALTAQEQQKALESQQADAQLQAFKATVSQNDFVGPDQARVGDWLNIQEKELAKKLKDEYQGDVTRFMKTEGPGWLQASLLNLKNSTEYKQAVHNREQIARHEKARAAGEVPIGRVVKVNGKDRYVSPDEDIDAFTRGIVPTYTFAGSYKDDDDDLKDIRETYAPGRYSWERVQASPDEVFNQLLAKNPAEVAADKFYRKYRKAQVFYKSDPIEKSEEFKMKLRGFNADMALKGQQYQKNQLDIDEKKREAAAEKAGYGPGFLLSQLQNARQGPVIDVSTATDRTLPVTGLDLNVLSGKRGAVQLSKIPLHGDAQNIIPSALNMSPIKSKGAVTGWKASLREGFTEHKGVPLNFDGVNYKVVDKDNDLYFPQNQLDRNGMPVDSRTGPTGFARVKVQLDSEEDAERLGLYKNRTFWFDSTTEKASTTHYNPDDRSIWIYTPVSPLGERNFQHSWQKEQLGQSTANMGLGLGRKRTN